jgi:hypothetical protein
MSDLIPFNSGLPARQITKALSRHERREARADLARMELHAEQQIRAAELTAEIGQLKVLGMYAVGDTAITAQAGLATTTQRAIENEPGAIHAVANTSQRASHGIDMIVTATAHKLAR